MKNCPECVKTTLPVPEPLLQSKLPNFPWERVQTKVRQFCSDSWPEKSKIAAELIPYWRLRGELSVCDDLLLYDTCIVVPKSAQQEALRKVHQGHQGILKCRQKMKTGVWWPGVSKAIENIVKNCPECAKTTLPAREPLLQSTLPNFPWEKVATDLFE